MKKYKLAQTDLEVTRICYGCMQIAKGWSGPLTADDRKHGVAALSAALEAGINFFDHADIYCGTKSETLFAAMWEDKLARREDVIVQTKCGIRFPDSPVMGYPHRYDFSYEHITQSVEGSLKRLGVEYLDLLLLHRPDVLVEPEEVARAFDDLHRSGKVRWFGVSNHNGGQIELLKRYVKQPLVANQLEFSLMQSRMLEEGIMVNRPDAGDLQSAGVLEYCRLNDIMIQAWSPLARGRLANPKTPEEEGAAKAAKALADKYGVSTEAVLLAWILRHPAKMQPILGSCNPERIKTACAADNVDLTREEWYTLWHAARNKRMP